MKSLSSFALGVSVLLLSSGCDFQVSVPNSQVTQRGILDPSSAWSGAGNYTGIDETKIPVAGELCGGINVLGVEGSAVCEDTAMAPLGSNLILSGNTFYDSSGNKRSGTMTNQSAWDLRTAFPGVGYYTGTSNTPTASQICSASTGGQAVNGVSGTAVCQDINGTAQNSALILSGNTFYDTSGNKKSGSLTTSSPTQSAITGSENDDSVIQVTVSPGANELFSSVIVSLGSHFQKDNICSGKTIFGRLGTAACSLAFGSRGFRTPGSATERDMPIVATDDDGMDGSVVRPDTSLITSCGTAQTTLSGRIADCNLSWDGEDLGKTGEGKWSLVTKVNGYEVWQDERTGILWSDNLASVNWCQGSGNTENDGGVDCRQGHGLQPNSAVSVCAESGGLDSSGYDDAKGGMRKAATSGSPSVNWRLPTRADYLQAYANGMGYVLPQFSDGLRTFWTASVYSGSRLKAWYLNVGSDGYMDFSSDTRGASYMVRCVGR